MQKNKFYITTSIAYTNAKPHIGYALELLQADALARHHRQKGDDVFFLTGTDEHGKKIQEKAQSENKDTQAFVDEISSSFRELGKTLEISNDFFIRTTDKKTHLPAVNELWSILNKNGDIYKGKYEAYYCVGCEKFFSDIEAKSGICEIHKKPFEKISEENYFFRLSKYAEKVKELIEKDEINIVPKNRKKEILNLFGDAVEDVSFSRPKESVGWGIDLPDDSSQKIYVWADALTNYISGLGGFGSENFQKFWPADVHLIGKDILRFHAMLWPAMLLSLGVPLPKSIYVHGFITAGGVKMSKSLGNVIDPFELVNKYGKEAVRHYLLREIPSDGDGDFSQARFEEVYKNDLQNGIGNLVSRVTNIGEKNKEILKGLAILEGSIADAQEYKKRYDEHMANFEIHLAVGEVMKIVDACDKIVEESRVWELPKKDEKEFKKVMEKLSSKIAYVALFLTPFLPETSKKIFLALGVSFESGEWKEREFNFKKPEPLFPRI